MTQKVCRVFHHYFTPILTGVQKRYRLELPLDASPRPYRTMTTDMRSWDGEVVNVADERATALIQVDTPPVQGKVIGAVQNGGPCVIMEHITIGGELEYMIGDRNILAGNLNFINFGIPNGTHLRIDVYTGESKVINGNI